MNFSYHNSFQFPKFVLTDNFQSLETTLVFLENKLESISSVDSETKNIPQTVFTETHKEESNTTTTHEKVEKKTGESMGKNTS